MTNPLSWAPQSWKKACSSASAWEDQASGSGAAGASWPSAGSLFCRRRLEPNFRPFRGILCPFSMVLWTWGQRRSKWALGCGRKSKPPHVSPSPPQENPPPPTKPPIRPWLGSRALSPQGLCTSPSGPGLENIPQLSTSLMFFSSLLDYGTLP